MNVRRVDPIAYFAFSIAYAAMNRSRGAIPSNRTFSIAYAAMNYAERERAVESLFSIAYAAMNSAGLYRC